MSARTSRSALRAREFPVPHIERTRYELSCGAVLLVDRRAGAPVASLKVHLRGGHALDPAGREGTAYLTGRLADQGTERHAEEELAALLEPHGGSLRGDATGVGGSIEGGAWKLLVTLAAEVIRTPVYPEEKLARQKQRLLDRLAVERDDHRTQAGLLFRRLVYGDHWLGRPSYGTVESVARIGRDDLARFHRECWRPNRLVIGFSGGAAPAAVRRELEGALSGWEPGAAPPASEARFPELAPRSGVFASERQQVHVFLGHLGVRRSHPMYPALVVMDHVLGTGPGFSNRISRRLRDEEGLAYSVQADVHSSAGVLPGLFSAYIGTSPRHVERAVAVFLEEMRSLRDTRVGREELELAKSYLLGSHALGYERAARRASYLVAAERFGLPPDDLQTLPRAYAAVTAEDVRRAARECLFPDAPCLAVGGALTEERVARLLRTALRRGTGRARAPRAPRKRR